MIAGSLRQITMPSGYAKTMSDTCADEDGNAVDGFDTRELCLMVEGQVWNGCYASSCGCQMNAGDSIDKGECSAVTRQPVGGMSETTLTEACPTMFALGGARSCLNTVPGLDNIRMADLCPKECHGPVDMCGVAGGDGTTCAAEVVAQAWNSCPQACQECSSNKRGCMGFSSTFMSQLNIVAYASLTVGTMVYSAYFKGMPYRKLLGGAQVVLAIMSASDYLAVTFVDPETQTVLGLPQGVFFAFGEAMNDVMSQLKLMPLLVLAAQICPASIEGTLFAFVMQNSNTGNTYSNYFGQWIMDTMGLTQTDLSGLASSQLMRIAFKLSPLLYLFLVPDGNPMDVVKQIDDELNAEDNALALGGAAEPTKSDAPKAKAPFSYPMLVGMLMVMAGAPLMNAMNLSVTVLAIPVVTLIAVPCIEEYFSKKTPGGGSNGGAGALSEGLAGGDNGMDDQIQLGGAEPAAPPPTDYSNPTPSSFDKGEPTGPPPADITAL